MNEVRKINIIKILKTVGLYVMMPISLYILTDFMAGNSNSKIGDIGTVGRDITINHGVNELYQVHRNLSDALTNEEQNFVNLEKELIKHDKGLVEVINNLNFRLITLGDTTEKFDVFYQQKLHETGKILQWVKPCPKGYHPLDGSYIKSEHLRKTLGFTYYPDDNTSVYNTCMYIGL